MSVYQSPAKLNLALLVSPPRNDGYHPLHSLVQTVEWCDLLTVEPGEGSDTLDIVGSALAVEGNLVLSALAALREHAQIPPLTLTLEKEIPIEAGLGGGSSNAATILVAAESHGWASSEEVATTANEVGADVPLFLVGGSMDVSGVGELVERVRPLVGFALAIVVPDFGFSTVDVYRRWDEMEGPVGDAVPDAQLPPSLRDQIPMRNDLLPAALDIDSRLGDFMTDLRQEWGTAVCLTGSGSACFGYFGSVDEAKHAVNTVNQLTSVGNGTAIRPRGVAPA